MKTMHLISGIIFALLLTLNLHAQEASTFAQSTATDKVQALKDTLAEMGKRASNELFINHCKSFVKVIDAQTALSRKDSNFLKAAYDTFCTKNIANSRQLSSYLNRQRSFILSWKSPVDGVISLAWVTLPKDWNPESTYPMYVHLHGYSDSYGLPINFLTRSFIRGYNATSAYDDGYWLTPWGRGNLWYQGIAETDVWESITELKRLVNIDVKRQYLTGHSMGGFGAWYIASRSVGNWAALGVEAGALGYNRENELNAAVVLQLAELPVYFICGTKDEFLNVDQKAYNLLLNAGNTQTEFVTFEGAHEHLMSNDENLYLWMKEYVNENYTSVASADFQNVNDLKCYPNPFKSFTNISFQLKTKSLVRIAVYSNEGILLKTIVNKNLDSGSYNFKYNTSQSGVYHFRFEINGKQAMHKILVCTK